MGNTIGYLRVSTTDQDLEKNKHDILDFANDKDFGKVEWVEEKVSGKIPWKERKIKGIIDDLNKGDRLIVPELSRLGRSMLEIMEILAVAKEKGIHIYDIKGNWELNGSIQSKVMPLVFKWSRVVSKACLFSCFVNTGTCSVIKVWASSSLNIPVGSPVSGSLSISPDCGSGVSLVIRENSNALLFTRSV